MTATPFFHVGFLVHDLVEAQERFSAAFDVTWTEPTSGTVDFWEQGSETAPLDLTVVYSRQGPPHIELLQAQGDGIYAPERGEGFHHIGLWDPDCERRQAELESDGFPAVAAQFTPQKEIIVSYFDPDALHGVMLELVDEGRRPMMERWFSGAPFEQ